jgi:hypothetical protein
MPPNFIVSGDGPEEGYLAECECRCLHEIEYSEQFRHRSCNYIVRTPTIAPARGYQQKADRPKESLSNLFVYLWIINSRTTASCPDDRRSSSSPVYPQARRTAEASCCEQCGCQCTDQASVRHVLCEYPSVYPSKRTS